MPLLIYIGMVMSILYYYGVTQICAVKLGWIFQVTMGTTAIETLSVSANIFLNGVGDGSSGCSKNLIINIYFKAQVSSKTNKKINGANF